MKVSIVGLGPGAGGDLTGKAREALEASELIVGYTEYIELIKDEYGEKELLSTGMRKESDRCRMAVEKALEGRNVALVCSGDAGVYGIAGLVYEISQEYPPVEIEVIPGVTAALGGAALLGAPVTHDFAVISLSDLLTPWEKIERRLRCAGVADFVICLYNPASRSRPDHLKRACEILLETKSKETLCGIVKNIGRQGEESKILDLNELCDEEVDMFTTVIIGNSQTKLINDKMVTPRGYETKKD